MDDEPISSAGRALRDFYTYPIFICIAIAVFVTSFWLGVAVCAGAGIILGVVTALRTAADPYMPRGQRSGLFVYWPIRGGYSLAGIGIITCGIGWIIRTVFSR